MKQIQAKGITLTSWILSESGSRVAVLSHTAQGYKLLDDSGTSQYQDLGELEASKNWTIQWTSVEITEAAVSTVGNMPIKHVNPQNIELAPLASYTKTANSSIRFAAGYWALLFANGYTPAFCPKLATLAEYKHIGPFSTKLEMQTMVSQHNEKLR